MLVGVYSCVFVVVFPRHYFVVVAGLTAIYTAIAVVGPTAIYIDIAVVGSTGIYSALAVVDSTAIYIYRHCHC